MLALAVIAFCTSAADADLRVQVDRSEIGPDEPFSLRIEYDGAATPDLAPLQRDFTVLSSQHASHIQLDNGRMSRSRSWQLRLLPKRQGLLTVPALRLGAERSAPIRITVATGSTVASDGSHQAVRFDARVTPERRWVQAQITYVRRLLYTPEAQVYGDIPGLPEIPGAIVQPLAAPEPDSALLDGVQYSVVEQRFAIFPQRSGEFVIPTVSVDTSVGALGRSRHRALVSSAPLRVTVLPVPADYPAGAPWLPARDLAIDEHVRLPPVLEVGQPIVRTLRLRAEGLSMSILPDTPWRGDDAVRLYSEPPVVQESTDGMFITGTRLQRHTFVPTRPGTLRLPGVELVWWDVQTGALRRATLPGRTVTITGTALPDARQDVTGTTATAASEPPSPVQLLVTRIRAWPGAPWALAAVLAVAALLLAPALLRQGRRRVGDLQTQRLALRNAPASRARKHAAELHSACIAGDVLRARRAFTDWLALQPAAPRWADDEPVRRLRHALGQPHAAWAGQAFWRWFATNAGAQASAGTREGASPDAEQRPAGSALPALYPASARDLETTS